jgi:hypothetical protein
VLKEFLKSTKTSKQFIEDVTSGTISQTTDAPPETRIRKPDDEIETVKIDKN